jgi:hypothetical protein
MTDERLLARLRGRGIKDTIAAADRIEALTAKVKLMDDLDVINGEKIEALTAKLAKAVEALRAVEKHEVSVFWGVDAEKNRRASWRGVMRKIKATLAEIEGEKE